MEQTTSTPLERSFVFLAATLAKHRDYFFPSITEGKVDFSIVPLHNDADKSFDVDIFFRPRGASINYRRFLNKDKVVYITFIDETSARASAYALHADCTLEKTIVRYTNGEALAEKIKLEQEDEAEVVRIADMIQALDLIASAHGVIPFSEIQEAAKQEAPKQAQRPKRGQKPKEPKGSEP